MEWTTLKTVLYQKPIDRYYAKAQCTQKRVEYERNRSKPIKFTLKL
jgi:hypothetical protein